VNGGVTFENGVLDISRAHLVSSMGATFFQAILILINLLWFEH
jgi:hypothetical protein